MPATVSQGSSRAWEALTPSLSEWILDAVSAMGFEEMTPVQASTIPLFIGNKDVVVEAVTGSGKTLAFLIPVVEKLLRLEEPIKKHHVGAVIVSPTRELATQIYSVLLKLLAFHQPSAATLGASDEDHDMEMEKSSFSNELKVIPQLLLGGNTSPAEDLKKFLEKSPNLLISTPGRLVELLGSPYVHTPQSSFEVLVLDEADRLLDLGFKDDLQKILGRLPKQRRTGLFSASVSEAVYEIVRVGLRNPFKIGVKVKRENRSGDKTPASLRMTFLETSPLQKLPAVCSILRNIEPTPQKSIIFFSTCAAVDYFHRIFPSILPRIHGQQIASIPLHGKQPASARTKNFNAFTSSTDPTVLLTTDVAARGLDIPQVDLVVQLDPPTDPKDFLHRCGRAGRAGRKGLAVLLLQPGRELDYVTFLQVRKTPVEPYPGPVLTEEEAEHMSSKLQKEVLKDRMLHDKGTQAFVSWVRSYSKHQASSIFRLSDINWTEQARSWGLLQLPKIAEAKSWKGGRSLGVDVDWDNYKYKDKQKEKVRLTSLSEKQFENGKQDGEGYKKRESAAWNANKEVKEKRFARREKKAKKREAERWQGMTEQEKLKEKELKNLIEVVRNRQGEDEEFLGFD